MASCIQTVGCPKCGAKAGEFCRYTNFFGRLTGMTASLHAQRVEMYEAQR